MGIPGRRGAGSSSEKHQEKEAAEILEGARELGMFGQLGKWLGRAGIVLYEFAGGGGKRSSRGEEDSREGEELF